MAFDSQKVGAAAVASHSKQISKKTKQVLDDARVHPPKHLDVLQAILVGVNNIKQNFHTLAEVDSESKLTQSNLAVIVVDEVLRVAKIGKFDLCKNNDFFYTFNGSSWTQTDKQTIKDLLGKAAFKAGVKEILSKSFEFKEKLFKQFCESAYLPKPENHSKTVLINIGNGTYEVGLNDRKLRDHDRNDFLTYQLPFSFDENATCPKFLKFLAEVLPDLQCQDLLAEYFGYVFTKHLKLEKALFLHGGGQNGKGVVYDIMRAILGKENVTSYSLADLMLEHNRALISDKLLNYSSEANASINRDIFKNLVSNEAIMARLKYGQSFMMTDYAKLAFNTNSLPKETEHTKAFFRRFLIVPFNVTIDDKNKNPNLANEIIESELSGIFNWILQGLQRLLKQSGFSDCKASDEALATYQTESDSVCMFLDEEGYKAQEESRILLKDFYAEYKTFCTDDGYRAVSKRNFTKRLKILKIQVEKGAGNKTFAYVSN